VYTIVEAFENVYGKNNREGIITEVLKQENLWKNVNLVKLNFYDFIKTPCEPYDLVWLDFGTGKEYMKAVSYFYENWKDQFVHGAKDIEHESVQRKFYFRFEEEDFRHMCNNPQILLDYINSLDLS
jgi:hypothetical protein